MKKPRPLLAFRSQLVFIVVLVLLSISARGQTPSQRHSEQSRPGDPRLQETQSLLPEPESEHSRELRQRAQAHYQTGMGHLSKKQLGKAYASFRKALEAFPGMDSAFHRLAEIDFVGGRYTQAADLIREAIRLQPQKAEYQLVLASIQIQLERYHEALSSAQKAQLLDPSDAHAHFTLGLSYEGLHQMEEATAALERAIALDPSLGEVYFFLGSLYSREQKTFRLASENFRKALALGLDRPDVRKGLGSVLLELEEYEEAIRQLDRAVKDSPQNSELYYFLSTAYRRLGMTAQAASALEKYQALSAEEQERKDAETTGLAQHSAGMRYFSKKDFENAYDSFTNAIEAFPDLDQAFHGLASIDLEWGNRERASEWIRKAIRVQPRMAEYHFVLAQCLELTDVSGATEAIQKALDLDPTEAHFHNLLGNLLFSRGDHHRAVEAYRNAVAIDPDDALFHLNLSSALTKIGAIQEAKREEDLFRELIAQRANRKTNHK